MIGPIRRGPARRAGMLFALALVLLPGSPGIAQSNAAKAARDPQIIKVLGYLITAADMISPTHESVRAVMDAARGGNGSGVLLGCYLCPRKYQFQSDYADERAAVMVDWTYDLRAFVLARGGGHSYNLDYAPSYERMRAFGADWWKAHSETFRGLPSMHRAAWIYEAILDGVQVWDRYEVLGGTASGDEISYFDVLLSQYENASPVAIFF
jgi:hypothetical protein